MAYKLIA